MFTTSLKRRWLSFPILFLLFSFACFEKRKKKEKTNSCKVDNSHVTRALMLLLTYKFFSLSRSLSVCFVFNLYNEFEFLKRVKKIWISYRKAVREKRESIINRDRERESEKKSLGVVKETRQNTCKYSLSKDNSKSKSKNKNENNNKTTDKDENKKIKTKFL